MWDFFAKGYKNLGREALDKSEWLKVAVTVAGKHWRNKRGELGAALSIPISNDFDGDGMGIIKNGGKWIFLGENDWISYECIVGNK